MVLFGVELQRWWWWTDAKGEQEEVLELERKCWRVNKDEDGSWILVRNFDRDSSNNPKWNEDKMQMEWSFLVDNKYKWNDSLLIMVELKLKWMRHKLDGEGGREVSVFHPKWVDFWKNCHFNPSNFSSLQINIIIKI